MQIEAVKRNLNKIIRYNNREGSYRLVACKIKKDDKGKFKYSAELLDVRHGNSIIVCRLEDIEEVSA